MTVPERDPSTTAIVRASGLIAFEGGQVSTYDIGYTAGTILMDLQLLGTSGLIAMDDFVLDWTDSWAFKNPDIKIGYSHRTGMATRKDVTFTSYAGQYRAGSRHDRNLRQTGGDSATPPTGAYMRTLPSRRRSIWMPALGSGRTRLIFGSIAKRSMSGSAPVSEDGSSGLTMGCRQKLDRQ